jgi:hypothetical protein
MPVFAIATVEDGRKAVTVVNSSCDQFIVTRVGVRWKGAVPLDEWLEGRLALFKRFYAPTINAQSDKRFVVLLAFDQDVAPRWGSEFLAALEVPAEVVHCGPVWKDAISTRVRASRRGDVLSSTVDSDDGIAFDFVEAVRSLARPDRVLNLVDGVQFSTSARRFVRRRTDYTNPFVSLRSTSGQWILDRCGHKKVGRIHPVDSLESEPMWLVAVHGGNAHNTFNRSAMAYPGRRARARFPGVDFGQLRQGPRDAFPRASFALEKALRGR